MCVSSVIRKSNAATRNVTTPKTRAPGAINASYTPMDVRQKIAAAKLANPKSQVAIESSYPKQKGRNLKRRTNWNPMTTTTGRSLQKGDQRERERERERDCKSTRSWRDRLNSESEHTGGKKAPVKKSLPEEKNALGEKSTPTETKRPTWPDRYNLAMTKRRLRMRKRKMWRRGKIKKNLP